MNKLKKNIGYQTIYQLLNVLLPLITAPFLARVLGATQLGIMSYTTSIVNYFSLFAMMGIINYGTRSIAIVKEDAFIRNRVFSEIFYMQLISCSVALIVYIFYMLFVCNDNQLIAWIQIITILSCFFDVSWFFFGIEEFKITVVRSMIVRIISVALMLILIKDESDLWIYALLLLGSTFVSQIILWFYLPRYVKFVSCRIRCIISHFKANLLLFIPLLAMSVFHIMDKTMLGWFSTYEQSGFYYNADKVVNIPVSILLGIGTVMLPRMSSIAENENENYFNTIFNHVVIGIAVVSSVMAFGIASIAKEFTPLFFGKGYDECVLLIIVLAPVLFVKGMAFTVRYMYLIPQKKEIILTYAVIAGAVVNLFVNLVLIPRYGALGAVIGTLVAEVVTCVFQYYKIHKYINCWRSIRKSMVYVIFGFLMMFVIRILAREISCYLFIKLLVEIAIGATCYCTLCFLYWKLTKNKMAMNIMKDIIKRK